ncbi:unnamed protein product, partial [Amoebophrya sp. A25]
LVLFSGVLALCSTAKLVMIDGYTGDDLIRHNLGMMTVNELALQKKENERAAQQALSDYYNHSSLKIQEDRENTDLKMEVIHLRGKNEFKNRIIETLEARLGEHIMEAEQKEKDSSQNPRRDAFWLLPEVLRLAKAAEDARRKSSEIQKRADDLRDKNAKKDRMIEE